MPGIGAQGGGWESVSACLNSNGEGVWVPISRVSRKYLEILNPKMST